MSSTRRSFVSVFLTTVLFGLISATLAGCSAEVTDLSKGGDVPQKPTGSVGPFDVEFGDTAAYRGNFDANISQAAGKVEFFVPAAEARKIKIISVTSTVFGCNPDSTALSLWWNPDTTQTRGTAVQEGAVIELAAGKRGLLLVLFEGLNGCTRLKFTLDLQKAAAPNPSTFPDRFLGTWERSDRIFGTFRMTFSQTSGVVKAAYYNDCISADESMNGTVVKTDTSVVPNRVTIRIDTVTKEFYGGCSNVLNLKTTHQGQFLTCIAERTANDRWANFKLSCNLGLNTENFPRDWRDGFANWYL